MATDEDTFLIAYDAIRPRPNLLSDSPHMLARGTDSVSFSIDRGSRVL